MDTKETIPQYNCGLRIADCEAKKPEIESTSQSKTKNPNSEFQNPKLKKSETTDFTDYTDLKKN